jgi:hypothetical protein
MSYAYLTNDKSTTLKYLIKALDLTSANPEKGYGISDLTLAYWIAATKYPDIRTTKPTIAGIPAGTTLDNAVYLKLKVPVEALISANSGYLFNRFIARSGGNLNGPAGAAIDLAGSMFGSTNYLRYNQYGKCYMFNNAGNGSTDTTPSCDLLRSQGITNLPFTKGIYIENDNSPKISEARNFLVDLGSIYDGRLDNHNYGPNPAYIYGGNLGELAKAVIGWSTKTPPGTPTGRGVQYGLDRLWKQNLFLMDFDKNLWNSVNVTKLVIKPEIAALPGKLDEAETKGLWDGRFKDSAWGWSTNMFKQFSKSDTWLDPATGIAGLVLGAKTYNQWTEVDKLIDFIWYISNDYGGVPYTRPELDNVVCNSAKIYRWTANLTPLYYYQTTRTQPSTCPSSSLEYGLILPLTYIERYTLSAMLLDNSLTLPSLNYPPPNTLPSVSTSQTTQSESIDSL